MYDLGVELRQAGGYVDKETQESVNIEDGFREQRRDAGKT